MKISWFFVVILLLTNFTLIESLKAMATGRRSYKQNRSIGRRRFYRPKSGSTRYYAFQKTESKNRKAWAETPSSPALPDRAMEYAKRLNYLAANKNTGKSNIGRLLSGS